MWMTAKPDSDRFQIGADKYAAYLETPEGRLRADLAFANLQEFLPASAGVNSLRALDLGCGTGAAAVRLARLGIHIADYLPAQISRSAEYERIFALERKLGKRREFFGVARYMHCLASCATPGSEGDE